MPNTFADASLINQIVAAEGETPLWQIDTNGETVEPLTFAKACSDAPTKNIPQALGTSTEWQFAMAAARSVRGNALTGDALFLVPSRLIHS